MTFLFWLPQKSGPGVLVEVACEPEFVALLLVVEAVLEALHCWFPGVALPDTPMSATSCWYKTAE